MKNNARLVQRLERLPYKRLTLGSIPAPGTIPAPLVQLAEQLPCKQPVGSSNLPGGSKQWVLGDKHPTYGEVVMMGRLGGEAYRWFDDGCGSVTMIPLSFLQDSNE